MVGPGNLGWRYEATATLSLQELEFLKIRLGSLSLLIVKGFFLKCILLMIHFYESGCVDQLLQSLAIVSDKNAL